VRGVKSAQELMNLIDQAIGRKQYTLNIINHGTIKIMTSLEYHKVVVGMFKRNMHYCIDLEKLTQEIENHGHKVRNVWNIKNRVSGRPLSLFFVDLEPDDSSKEIYDITYLQNVRMQFEPPHQKRNGIPQYKKCQGYFTQKLTVNANRDVPNGENYIKLNIVKCREANQRNGCSAEKTIHEVTEVENSTRKSIRSRFPVPKPLINDQERRPSQRQEEQTLLY
jgi:hypothetical protein